MLRSAAGIIFFLFALTVGSRAQETKGESAANPPVVVRDDRAFPGYTLFAPLNSVETFLVDVRGRVVHKWKSEFPPGQSVHFLDNGHILRCARDPGDSPFHGGGEGGRVEEFDWDGNLVWTYVHCGAEHRQHHDVAPLPNGHVLVISWEGKSSEAAIAAGRDAAAAEHGLWPDYLVEIEPILPVGGQVVWEWHVWDHLIQDRDPKRAGYGSIAEHPELIDINANRAQARAKPPETSPEEVSRLAAIGYVGESGNRKKDDGGGDGPGSRRFGPLGMDADWNHINSVSYNAERDQILLSSHSLSEIWIIDHGTTTKEAASHTGGRYGHGGDLLYRWGNPSTYRAGDDKDQRLFGQHDARWIAKGLPGEGHILVFNNGSKRGFGFGPREDHRGDQFSSVVEIAPPLVPDGRYALERGKPFGPAEPVWSYSDHESDPPFFSPLISGAERLANRDTLICSGIQNRVFEVTPDGIVVWDYHNPFGLGGDRGPGEVEFGGAPGRPPRPGPSPGGGGMPHPGLFRATRIALDHPALKGKALEPIGESAPEKKAE